MGKHAVAGVCTGLMAAAAVAGQWSFSNSRVLDALGTRSSLWAGSVCYLAGPSGPIRYYDGESFYSPYLGTENCYEPANANGVIAWRVTFPGLSNNEIYRWDGTEVVNISASDQVDTDVDVGSNGDVIWSQDHSWLYYYSAETGETAPLGISGKFPQLYIAEDGTPTFAYQDPLTNSVLYFDGETTHNLGVGAHYSPMIALWDGAVAWVAEGAGVDFTNSEIMFWKDGVTTRITNDDLTGQVQDDNPSIWNGCVVWSRYPNGPIAPRLFLWDGRDIHQMTTTNAKYASFHNCQVTYMGTGGLYIADLVLLGDINCDGAVNTFDIDPFVIALTDADGYAAEFPDCSPWSADINRDGAVNTFDIDPFVALLVSGG